MTAGHKGRIEQAFTRCRNNGRTALGIYAVAGDPDEERSLSLMTAILDAGADFLEIGIPAPHSDLDGPAIQGGFRRAKLDGARLEGTLQIIAELRRLRPEAPLIAMGYGRDLDPEAQTDEDTLDQLRNSGADGLIVPDLADTIRGERMRSLAQRADLGWVPVVASDEAANLDVETTRPAPFVYLRPTGRATGEMSGPTQDFLDTASDLRSRTEATVGIGFSIREADHVRCAAPYVDAVIVGSAIVGRVPDALAADSRGPIVEFVRSLSAATRRDR